MTEAQIKSIIKKSLAEMDAMGRQAMEEDGITYEQGLFGTLFAKLAMIDARLSIQNQALDSLTAEMIRFRDQLARVEKLMKQRKPEFGAN